MNREWSREHNYYLRDITTKLAIRFEVGLLFSHCFSEMQPPAFLAKMHYPKGDRINKILYTDTSMAMVGSIYIIIVS